MKKIACVFLFCFPAIHTVAVNQKQLDSLYHCIDHAIEHATDYIANREARIDRLRKNLSKSANREARLDYTFQLYEEYKSYQNDSAFSKRKGFCYSLQ